MLTITVRIETPGLGTRVAEDIRSALSYLGRVERRGPAVFLEYYHSNHEAVCALLASWTGWVQAAALETAEADFGHGASTLTWQPEKTDPKVLFVAPVGKTIPEDGVFDYTTIDDLSDVELVKSRSVILFRRDQADLLTTLSRDWKRFAPAVLSLLDAPGGGYDAWFNDATLGLDRIAYEPFVAELRAAKSQQQPNTITKV